MRDRRDIGDQHQNGNEGERQGPEAGLVDRFEGHPADAADRKRGRPRGAA